MPMYDWQCDTCGKVKTKLLHHKDLLTFSIPCTEEGCPGKMERLFPSGMAFKMWEDKK